MTEDEMRTKACHKTHRGETVKPDGTPLFPEPATCLGAYCMAFRSIGNACYCADLKRDA